MASDETVAEIVKQVRRECNSYPLPANAAEMLRLVREIKTAHEREIVRLSKEIAELRELLIELANAANTAFDDIAKCGSIIADGDVRDAAYRTHLMERIAKYRKVLEGSANEVE